MADKGDKYLKEYCKKHGITDKDGNIKGGKVFVLVFGFSKPKQTYRGKMRANEPVKIPKKI